MYVCISILSLCQDDVLTYAQENPWIDLQGVKSRLTEDSVSVRVVPETYRI